MRHGCTRLKSRRVWESCACSTALYHIYILTPCMSQIYEAGSAPPLIVGGLTATAAREAAEVCLFIFYLCIYKHIIYLSMMPHTSPQICQNRHEKDISEDVKGGLMYEQKHVKERYVVKTSALPAR